MRPLIYHNLRYWHPPTHGSHRFCNYEQKDLGVFFRPQEMKRAGRDTDKITKDIERAVEALKTYNSTLVLCSSCSSENILFEEVYEKIKRCGHVKAYRSSLRIFYRNKWIIFRNINNVRGIRADKLIIYHDVIDQLDYHPSEVHRIHIRKTLQQLTIRHDPHNNS